MTLVDPFSQWLPVSNPLVFLHRKHNLNKAMGLFIWLLLQETQDVTL